MFHAVVVKKAAALSSNAAIADLMGHTHLIADKRMPVFAITGIVATLLLTFLNYHSIVAVSSATALILLLIHLGIYLKVAKPINTRMSAAAVTQATPEDIRSMQVKWDSAIIYRAILLTLAMVAIIAGSMLTS